MNKTYTENFAIFLHMLNLFYATTVLIIGDSHLVGPFGWHLDQLLRNDGHQVATYASCGSTAQWWFSGNKTGCGYYQRGLDGEVKRTNIHPTPLVKELLKEVKPNVVIVELGSNYVKNKNDESVVNEMRALARTVRDNSSTCYWLTPPDMRLYRTETRRLNSLIEKSVSEYCSIFYSDEVTAYPEEGGDGVHYWFPAGTPIANEWAEAVSKLSL